jgi:hypothetical protein
MSDATRRSPLLQGLALLSVLAVPVAALALVTTLPHAPEAERIASAALAEVREARSVRSVETLPGQTLRASCRTLSDNRSLIAFSNGVRLRIMGGHSILWRLRRLPPQLQRSLYREILLAGCPNIVAWQLGHRLSLSSFRKRGPAFLHLHAHGDDLYSIRLSGSHPLLELELRQAAFDPVGIVLHDGRLGASSRLVVEKPRLSQRGKTA